MEYKFETKTIHAGVEPDPSTGAIMTPIFQTSTYVQDGPGGHKGYEYSRTHNPTRAALEKSLAFLENGKYGLCFGSGMAAIDTLMKVLKPGDEVVSVNDLYGGTYRLFTKVYENYGIKFHFVNVSDLAELRGAVNNRTKLIWVETPTNPLLKITDIKSVVSIAKERGILVAVDNTFATPYNQTPLDLGADIVMHSMTKYICGHSDVVMGCLVVKDDALAEQLYFLQNSAGAVPGPQDCFLALRGIKTLHLRMQRHNENGKAMAQFLKSHPTVGDVYWPGFEDHEGHEVASSQMRGFGGMISFNLRSGKHEDAVRILKNTHLFACAESLGGVESLIGHPASMTHASIPKEEREKNGITDTLIRLSVGVEHIDDLINDLANAMN
ncbi:MAG: cystathionine gamma-synthase [Flavobacteriales bacterium]|nr:cystathionine gamma-synthase [Flavobacteriales bacterium]